MIAVSPKRFIIQEIPKVFARIFSFWELHRALLLRSALIFGLIAAAPLLGILVVLNPLAALIAAVPLA
ncbi:MAG TPA: hypothetical protein VEC93_25005, partial [Anaerolineae bacterium]|nr:hypothetical protein [Anaerolineae bacterium]